MKYLKLFENYDQFYKELDFHQNLNWTNENESLTPMSTYEIKWLLVRFPDSSTKWVYKDETSLTRYAIRENLSEDPVYGINLSNKKFTLHIEKNTDEYYHITYSTYTTSRVHQPRTYRYFVSDQFDGLKKFIDNEIPKTI